MPDTAAEPTMLMDLSAERPLGSFSKGDTVISDPPTIYVLLAKPEEVEEILGIAGSCLVWVRKTGQIYLLDETTGATKIGRAVLSLRTSLD